MTKKVEARDDSEKEGGQPQSIKSEKEKIVRDGLDRTLGILEVLKGRHDLRQHTVLATPDAFPLAAVIAGELHLDLVELPLSEQIKILDNGSEAEIRQALDVTGELHLNGEPVLLVLDWNETGNVLSALTEHLKEKHAAESIISVSLYQSPEAFIKADYFTVAAEAPGFKWISK